MLNHSQLSSPMLNSTTPVLIETFKQMLNRFIMGTNLITPSGAAQVLYIETNKYSGPVLTRMLCCIDLENHTIQH